MLVYNSRARGTSTLSGGSGRGAHSSPAPPVTHDCVCLQVQTQLVLFARHCGASLEPTYVVLPVHVKLHASKMSRPSTKNRSQLLGDAGTGERDFATFSAVHLCARPGTFSLCAR